MRCPSCGAIIKKKRSMKCAECGAFRNKTWVDTEPAASCAAEGMGKVTVASGPSSKRGSESSTSLLEFPSPMRQAIPEWRKELGERVRELHEKRAREASLEGGQTDTPTPADDAKGARPLELLSKPAIPPTNPLVIAALRRIERAHAHSQFSGNTAVARAAAYEEQPAFDLALPRAAGESNAACADLPKPIEEPIANEAVPQAGKPHRLSVVSSPAATVPKEPVLQHDAEATAEGDLRAAVKPKRLIRDNDPVLNYLDSVPTTVTVDMGKARSAPVFLRTFGAIVDLLVVAAISAPIVPIIGFAELPWQDPRAIAFAASAVVIAAFSYLTISTALTGRTLGMRLFRLRVIDTRNGLIPTGTQSAGRALFYLMSLATAGIGLLFIFADSERQTAHDRFTRTAVVRI